MAHIERRGQGRWRARYRGPDGRERSRTFERRTDAERWLASVEVSKSKGDWVDPALGRRTFAWWVTEWEPTLVSLRESTIDRDRRIVRTHLLPRFANVPLAAITTREVARFIADLMNAGDHSPATVRKIGQVLSKVMRGAVEAGLIARNPCSGVRLPVEPKRDMQFLNAVQVAALATAVGPEWSTLIMTAAFTGMRWGELAGLRPERVSIAGKTIAVVEQLTEVSGDLYWGPPKTAAGRRSIAVPSSLAVLLEDQLQKPKVDRAGLVFPTPLGEPMRRSNFARRVWAPATKALGLDGLRFHDLRHTAVALAISKGAHPKAIQERMGHSSITVTLDRYGHLFDGLDTQIADSLDDLITGSRGLSAASAVGE